MKDYVVMDLENPNFKQNSISSIGLLLIRDHKVVDSKYSLINPEDSFDPMNIDLTGLNPSVVADAPTLPEYWDQIKSWLLDNVILGHNITYDLRVLSKSLQRYGMSVPSFRYMCSLNLSRRYLNLKSNKLENVAKNLNIQYDPHIAIEDARASYEVYEYINKHNDLSEYKIKDYNYKPTIKDKLDPKLARNINNLYGMIQVLRIEENITTYHINLLRKWYNENYLNNEYKQFNKIAQKLSIVLDMDHITPGAIEKLAQNVPMINKSAKYNQTTLQTHVFQGIIDAITIDYKITRSELEYLDNWLNTHTDFIDIYPYTKINKLTKEALTKDLTQQEQYDLATQLKETLTQKCDKQEEICFDNKTYCLTGDFKHGNKDQINQILTSMGLIKKSNISKKLDYLFVGSLGSPSWKYGKIGGKIIKAQKLQEEGLPIKIIDEECLFNQIKEKQEL
ncbi:MAG: hypothetical protein LUG89_02485 [Methanosphaera sp.]|nr:hypothetical protein [Methanosphaera sp.]